MSQAQFTLPLITVIPGQLITASLWNNEWNNIDTNLNPSGVGGYSDTDTQMQIQTAPYPGSVTSHATNEAGEWERVRYQISAILGATTPPYWYAKPPIDLTTLQAAIIPVGGIFDYPSGTAPSNNYHLADGTAINRVLFPTLFTLIGTTFGVGDGTTTFNLPNLTDRMTIAAGNLYALAATGGAINQTLAKNQIPAGLLTLNDPGHPHSITDPTHNHSVTDPTHTHVEQYKTSGNSGNTIGATVAQGNGSSTSSNSPSTVAASTGISLSAASTGITGANSNTTGISLTDNGGSTPVSTLPPYLGLYKMIRVL